MNIKKKVLLCFLLLSINSCSDEVAVVNKTSAQTSNPTTSDKNPESTSPNSYIPPALVEQVKLQEQIAKDTQNLLSKGVDAKSIFPFGTSESDWGVRPQIAGTYEDLKDLQGNNDGIWENEKDLKGLLRGVGTNSDFKEWFEKPKDGRKNTISTTLIIKELNDFLSAQEQRWKLKATFLDSNKIKYGKLFSVQKAINLLRFNRKPSDVVEGFVKSDGKVNGIKIESRDIFWQRFKPISAPNGKMILFSPGYQETGRNFYEQIDKLNKIGFDVVVMDHQWGGQTKVQYQGVLDRGYGLALDVASMAYLCDAILEKEYKDMPKKELILSGNSVGASAVLMALTLNDNDKIVLERDLFMPKNLRAVLQSVFLGIEESKIKDIIYKLQMKESNKTIELYNTGLPIFTNNASSYQKGVQYNILENVTTKFYAITNANKDINETITSIESGIKPNNNIYIINADKDPLVDFSKVENLVESIGNTAKLTKVNSENHVFQNTLVEQDFLVSIFKTLQ